MSAAKKQKTDEENVVWPEIKGVDKPLLSTLATVCAKLYDEALYAAWEPNPNPGVCLTRTRTQTLTLTLP